MRVLVLGCGNIGSVIARDFAESMEESQIVVADREEERAKKVASSIEDAA